MRLGHCLLACSFPRCLNVPFFHATHLLSLTFFPISNPARPPTYLIRPTSNDTHALRSAEQTGSRSVHLPDRHSTGFLEESELRGGADQRGLPSSLVLRPLKQLPVLYALIIELCNQVQPWQQLQLLQQQPALARWKSDASTGKSSGKGEYGREGVGALVEREGNGVGAQ